MIDLEHALHGADELGVGLRWDHPLLPQPRLQSVFLRTRRTVSSLTAPTTSSSTRRSASIFSVQRALPPGGVEQARATSLASCAPSSLRYWRPVGLRRWTAASRSPSANRFRTRATVSCEHSRASAMAVSPHPGPPGPASALRRSGYGPGRLPRDAPRRSSSRAASVGRRSGGRVACPSGPWRISSWVEKILPNPPTQVWRNTRKGNPRSSRRAHPRCRPGPRAAR